jgi:hypothetical protein
MEDLMSQSHTRTVFVSGFLALSACHGHARAPQVAKAEPVESASATASESIAEARCDREARCNNVGIDRRYSSVEDCRTRVWIEWGGELDARQCQAGLQLDALDKCLTEIRILECSSTLESLERLAACSPNLICSH